MKPGYIKYKIVIDGSVAKWSGYIYALCHEDAFDIASDLAVTMGGDFIDVLMCYPCEDGE